MSESRATATLRRPGLTDRALLTVPRVTRATAALSRAWGTGLPLGDPCPCAATLPARRGEALWAGEAGRPTLLPSPLPGRAMEGPGRGLAPAPLPAAPTTPASPSPLRDPEVPRVRGAAGDPPSREGPPSTLPPATTDAPALSQPDTDPPPKLSTDGSDPTTDGPPPLPLYIGIQTTVPPGEAPPPRPLSPSGAVRGRCCGSRLVRREGATLPGREEGARGGGRGRPREDPTRGTPPSRLGGGGAPALSPPSPSTLASKEGKDPRLRGATGPGDCSGVPTGVSAGVPVWELGADGWSLPASSGGADGSPPGPSGPGWEAAA